MAFAASHSEDKRGGSSSYVLPYPKDLFSTLKSPPDITDMVAFLDKRPEASGGFCDIYRGVHKKEGMVALKLPRMRNSELAIIRRFWREVDTWYNSKHKNILPLLGVVKVDNDIYMVSRWAEHGTLLQFVQMDPNANRLPLVSGLADGIQFLHEQGVIHGDLKAANVLVDRKITPLIIDFGLSKTLDTSHTSTDMSGVGSIRWSSPEILEGGSKTNASDVYAFGLTISEVLSGCIPFYDLRVGLAVMRAATAGKRPAKEPLRSPSGQSFSSLWDLAEICWNQEPENRPTMSEVIGRIESLMSGGANKPQRPNKSARSDAFEFGSFMDSLLSPLDAISPTATATTTTSMTLSSSTSTSNSTPTTTTSISSPLRHSALNTEGSRSSQDTKSPLSLSSYNSEPVKRKLVMVGDGISGKSALLILLSKGTFPEVYLPITPYYDLYMTDLVVNGINVELSLWDTPGQEEYDRLRGHVYPDSHLVVICFAIDGPDSLDNVQEKWISEVMHFCSNTPIVLLGCKKDLRNDMRVIAELRKTSQRPITPLEGQEVATKIGAMLYLECSAKTGEGIPELVNAIGRIALSSRSGKKSKRRSECIIS